MKNMTLRALSILFLVLGVLTGLALFGCATWADIESVFYGFNRYGNELTTAMHCPIVMSSDETATLRMTFRNTSDNRVRPSVRFQASNEGAFREETQRLVLEAGEQETLEWMVSSEDLVLDRFIFAKMFTFASYPLENIEQTCGILVLKVDGLSGKQMTIAAIALSLMGMAAGIGLWAAAHKPLKYRSLEVMRAMVALAVTVIGGIVSTLLAWWLVGVLLAMLTLILSGVILGYFVTTEKV